MLSTQLKIDPDAEARFPEAFQRIREAVDLPKLPEDYKFKVFEVWVDGALVYRVTKDGPETIISLPDDGTLLPWVVEFCFDGQIVHARSMSQTLFDHTPETYYMQE
jgi:hypothetical protein